jgi:hypothetical protein
MTQRPKRRSAFTLVELVLAVSLTALILVETASAFRGAADACRGARLKAEGQAQGWSVLRLIGQDVAHLACQVDPGRASLLAVADGGDTPLLRLRTVARVGPGERDMVVDYFLVDDPAVGRPLVRRSEAIADSTSAGSAAPASAGPSWEVIATDVKRFAVRCFDGAQWVERWDAAQAGRLPSLVEVTVELNRPELSEAEFTCCYRPIPGRPFMPSADAPRERNVP